jgi:transposase
MLTSVRIRIRSNPAINSLINLLRPVNSPDLNPIENIWRWLKVYVAKKWPKTREEVEMACIGAWDALDLTEIRKRCGGESIRARCQAVIDGSGGNTKY